MRVLGAEPLDGVFGGKDNPTVGCILDACGFVHLVAERRDFQPATRRDLADHEGGTPMHADLDAHAVPQCRCPVTNFAHRLNRAARRGAVTAGILSKKQRKTSRGPGAGRSCSIICRLPPASGTVMERMVDIDGPFPRIGLGRVSVPPPILLYDCHCPGVWPTACPEARWGTSTCSAG